MSQDAVEALPSERAQLASTTQNVGQVIGMLSWSIYFQATDMISFGEFMLLLTLFQTFIAVVVVVFWTIATVPSEHEVPLTTSGEVHGFKSVLGDVNAMFHNETVRRFTVILFCYPLPYLASYTLAAQLQKLGIGADVLTRVSLVCFPIDFLTSHLATKYMTPERPLRMWYRVYVFCIGICAVTPYLVYAYQPEPRSWPYMAVFIIVVVALRQCGTFCFVTIYGTFALYCKYELCSTSSTGTQMTALSSISNLARLLSSSVASYSLHFLTVYAPDGTVPYYVLTAVSVPVGLAVALLIVEPRISKITFKAIQNYFPSPLRRFRKNFR